MKKPFVFEKGNLPLPVLESHPEWIGIYYAAWEKAFANLEYPEKEGWLPQLTCMPGVGIIWQWDSCFMSFFAKYSNGFLPAMNNLDNLYRMQDKDGFLGMAYVIESGKPAYGARINPPIFAWAEWEYYLFTGDDSRFERVFPVLFSYYQWLRNNRRRKNGLYWFEDSGSSGMDNSPRSGYASENLGGSDICWIDLISQQALSASFLAKIAEHVGRYEDATSMRSEYEDLCRLINKYHWSAKSAFYFDVFNRTNPDSRHNFLNTKTIASFWPLLCSVADEEQTEKILRHLFNPEEFWTLHPVPTLSKDDPNYNPSGDYWLGGVWAPSNYMIIKALQLNKRHAEAKRIAEKHLEAMANVLKDDSYGNIWEAYAPESFAPATKDVGNGVSQLVRKNFVGWSGLGPVAMFIESILGLSFDSSSNTISWRISEPSFHGIKNLKFNGRVVSMLCDKALSGKRIINIETSGELNFVATLDASSLRHENLSPGKHKLQI